MWRFLFAVSCIFSLCAAYDEAEPLRCNRPNEIAACVHPCPPERTCRNREIKFRCRIEGKCEEKCVCKEGYFRNPLGVCITGNECDMCSGANEFFSCGPECDNVCSELNIQNRTNCPIVNIVCNRKCYCEDGFARDENKECVSIDKCSAKSGSRVEREVQNEPLRCHRLNEIAACVHPCPPERTCRNKDILFNCINPEKCEEKCVCKEGYFRNPLGDCITVNECAAQSGSRVEREIQIEPKCGQNEEYVSCKRSCPPETCISLVALFKCDSNEPCRARCACKEGFLRLKTGEPCEPTRRCSGLAHSPDK